MTQALIRKCLDKRLASMGVFATAQENMAYTPVAGTPYQKVNVLWAAPDNSIQGARTYFEIGIYQVTLCYPVGNGSTDIDARSQLLRAQFKRGTSMTESGVTTLVTKTPRISPGFVDGDRWCIPVSVPFQAQITT